MVAKGLLSQQGDLGELAEGIGQQEAAPSIRDNGMQENNKATASSRAIARRRGAADSFLLLSSMRSGKQNSIKGN